MQLHSGSWESTKRSVPDRKVIFVTDVRFCLEYLWKLRNGSAIIFLKNNGKSKTEQKCQRISEKEGGITNEKISGGI